MSDLTSNEGLTASAYRRLKDQPMTLIALCESKDAHIGVQNSEIDRLTERLAGAYASVNLLTEMLEAKAPQEATGVQYEELEKYSRDDGLRDWVSVGAWLHPGERIVLEYKIDEADPAPPRGGEPESILNPGRLDSVEAAVLNQALEETGQPHEPKPSEASGCQCWETINAMIKPGELQGNGCDQTAQRNGLILAANALASRRHSHEPLPTHTAQVRCRKCGEKADIAIFDTGPIPSSDHMKLLEEAELELRHSSIFVRSREKMHPTGLDLYDDLLRRIQVYLGNPSTKAEPR